MGAPGGVVWPSAWLDGFTVSSPLLRTGSPGNSPRRVTIGAMFFQPHITHPAGGRQFKLCALPPTLTREAGANEQPKAGCGLRLRATAALEDPR